MKNYDAKRQLGLAMLRDARIFEQRARAGDERAREVRRSAAIKLDDSIEAVVTKLAEGNVGTFRILQRLVGMGMWALLLDLEDMNIRGEQVWIAYKEYCKTVMQKFVVAVQDRDEEMIRIVNEVAQQRGIPHVARTRGGAS